MNRTLTAVIAFAMLGLSPIALSGTATATPDHVARSSFASSDDARVLPRRNLNDRGVQKGGKLFIKGNVNPGGGDRRIFVQRKTTKNGSWRGFDKVRTGAKGGWTVRIHAPGRIGPRFYYRGFIKKYGGYARSYTNQVYVTCKLRYGTTC